MLALVGSDRDHVRLVKKDICCHQDRVGKQTGIDIIGMLCGLVLKLGHPVQLAHVGIAVEDPCQLCMRRDMGLIIQACLLRIDPGGNIEGKKASGAFAELRRHLPYRDRMHVHHAVEAFVFFRQCDPVLQRTEIVSEGKVPRRLHARE